MKLIDKLDELWKEKADLQSQLILKEIIETKVREMLLHSNIPINECENIFHFLNLYENIQPFTPEYREPQDELFRVLEMI